MNDKTLVERLRDEDSYYRIQEKHWCVDAEELERQRLAAADRIEALEAEVAQAAKAERDRLRKPAFWPSKQLDAMVRAFDEKSKKHGLRETLMAVVNAANRYTLEEQQP